MAIVKELETEHAKIFFHDDAFAGCGDELLRRREREIRDAAWWCAARAAERRKGETYESDTLPAVHRGGDGRADGQRL